MILAGIDAGSRTIKIVLLESRNMRLIGAGIADQSVRQAVKAEELFKKVLHESNVKKSMIAKIVATGYGRNALNWADKTVTEITCQAYGVRHKTPIVRTIIDIGGQDSKIISIDNDGVVQDFTMNERCAAGTGRFLEVVAERLEMKLKDIGAIAKKAKSASVINSLCVVFAEAEIVGLLASEESPENIVAGVQNSIAKKIAAMSGNKITGPVIFTGGVALIPGMKKALEKALMHKVSIAENPQMTGAFGAALIASLKNN